MPILPPTYQPRDPSDTVLYRVIADHCKTFLAGIDADPTGKGLPSYMREEFDTYLQCGILAYGFLRLGNDPGTHKMLLAFKRPCKDARALQEAGILSFLCRKTHGRDGGASGGPGHALGPNAPVGGVGTDSPAVLDGGLDRASGNGPYDHPPHHLAVL